jgi:hypothetical protein
MRSTLQRHGDYDGAVRDKNKVYLPLIHLIGGDLTNGITKGGDFSRRCFHGVVDLIQSTRVTCIKRFGSIEP